MEKRHIIGFLGTVVYVTGCSIAKEFLGASEQTMTILFGLAFIIPLVIIGIHTSIEMAKNPGYATVEDSIIQIDYEAMEADIAQKFSADKARHDECWNRALKQWCVKEDVTFEGYMSINVSGEVAFTGSTCQIIVQQKEQRYVAKLCYTGSAFITESFIEAENS